METSQTMKKNFPLLDLTQYAASLFVILAHCDRLAENDFIHFFLKVCCARLAVPIFLIGSSYFFRSKQKKNTTYPRNFFKRQWKTYLFWSLLYLPYGILFIQDLGIPSNLYLAALPVGLAYLGVCYHLWYFPALFLGLWLVRKWLRRFNYPIAFCICLLLFALGATETYSGYLQGTLIYDLYAFYNQLFMTTRNGLFYTPVFILIGFFLADYLEGNHTFLQRHIPVKFGISLILLGIETLIICLRQGDDKNFLFSLLPTSLFLMILLLRSNALQNRNFSHLRKSAQYLFFLHPAFLETTKWFLARLGVQKFQGIPLFLITFVLTTLSIEILFFIRKYLACRTILPQIIQPKNKFLTSRRKL
ncbi:acyltransferase family protein [Enterococcus sp. AZ007]|uniref:acyltransferase family protein n=1 Tax=Enterococcus sp. AZ007 TaxID=2774839 RepID=UPI003F2261A5